MEYREAGYIECSVDTYDHIPFLSLIITKYQVILSKSKVKSQDDCLRLTMSAKMLMRPARRRKLAAT